MDEFLRWLPILATVATVAGTGAVVRWQVAHVERAIDVIAGKLDNLRAEHGELRERVAVLETLERMPQPRSAR